MAEDRGTTEKTVIKSLGLSGGIYGAVPCAVDVKDGKIVRIRPLHYDSKYDSTQFNAWKITKNGKTFEPLMKAAPAPCSLAYKKRTYSPNRIKYPLKRVDWDPKGERNTQNRGKSKFVRISWDEATDLIANEIKRIHKEYGPLAILVQGDGHGECKIIHAPHGCSTLLLDKMGGFTQQVRNPDSWEGWYWGSKHVWGQGLVGMMDPADNIVKDITENSDMVLFWGCDPGDHALGVRGPVCQPAAILWTDIGIKQVYICPDLNYAAPSMPINGFPFCPIPMRRCSLAIIYIWIKEGTYDKEYVKTHTVGFDKIKAYVMGEEDGVPKTPHGPRRNAACRNGPSRPWRETGPRRRSPSPTISAAAWSGARTPMSRPGWNDPAGDAGPGKPGVHQTQITYLGMPRNILGAGRQSNGHVQQPGGIPGWATGSSSRTGARRRPGASSLFPRP